LLSSIQQETLGLNPPSSTWILQLVLVPRLKAWLVSFS
jgi:hypothetical protein